MSHVTYAEEIHALETTLARVRQEKAEAEAERDDLRAKMDAIGELCPTHYEDRDELLRALLRIRRGEFERDGDES